MRYYNKQDHNEVSEESEHTIPMGDPSVAPFFDPIPEGKQVIYVNDMPVYEDIPPPVPVDPQDAINVEHRQYLLSTDWMAIRAVDGGKAVPADVAAKRIAARAAIVD